MSVDISATYLARNTFFILLVNNSFRVHGWVYKTGRRKPRQTKQAYPPPPPPPQQKKKKKPRDKNRKTQKAREPQWKIFAFWEKQEVEGEEVQEEKLR